MNLRSETHIVSKTTATTKRKGQDNWENSWPGQKTKQKELSLTVTTEMKTSRKLNWRTFFLISQEQSKEKNFILTVFKNLYVYPVSPPNILDVSWPLTGRRLQVKPQISVLRGNK